MFSDNRYGFHAVSEALDKCKGFRDHLSPIFEVQIYLVFGLKFIAYRGPHLLMIWQQGTSLHPATVCKASSCSQRWGKSSFRKLNTNSYFHSFCFETAAVSKRVCILPLSSVAWEHLTYLCNGDCAHGETANFITKMSITNYSTQNMKWKEMHNLSACEDVKPEENLQNH